MPLKFAVAVDDSAAAGARCGLVADAQPPVSTAVAAVAASAIARRFR